MKKLVRKYRKSNLILRISIGLIIGIVFGVLVNIALNSTNNILQSDFSVAVLTAFAVIFKVFGNLFIGGLRAVAPVLVFFLITSRGAWGSFPRRARRRR